jgi:hypothetical protein
VSLMMSVLDDGRRPPCILTDVLIISVSLQM